MEHKTVYVCTGGCNGVSAVMKNCDAGSCAKLNQPLEARVQCDSCAAATERDNGKPHACPDCE